MKTIERGIDVVVIRKRPSHETPSRWPSAVRSTRWETCAYVFRLDRRGRETFEGEQAEVVEIDYPTSPGTPIWMGG